MDLREILVVVLLSQAELVSSSFTCPSRKPIQQSCNMQKPKQKDCRVYTFAFTLVEPRSMLVGSKVEGSRVELMKQVCCLAGKRCKAAAVEFDRCWNKDTRLSEVLNGAWYDACLDINLLAHPMILASYAGTSIPFFIIPFFNGIVRPNSALTVNALKSRGNNFKVAFLARQDTPQAIFLEKYREGGFFVKAENFISVDLPGGLNANTRAAVDMVKSGEVDVALLSTYLADFSGVKSLFELDNYDRGHVGLMVRKDNIDFLNWWDKHLKEFICSPQYLPFCDKMKEDFGDLPVHCVSKDTRGNLCKKKRNRKEYFAKAS